MHCARLLALFALASHAQPAAGLAGDWTGALEAGGARLRLVLHVAKTDDGLYLGKLDSLDQGSVIPLGKATVNGPSVKLEFPAVGGVFAGELSSDASELKGTWTQGAPLPLTLKRTASAPAPPKSTGEASAATAPRPGASRLDVIVPVPPAPFQGAGGRTNLIYELHITNFGTAEQNLTRIEVFGDAGSLRAYEGKDLIDILARPGTADLPDPRKIGPGLRAVAFLLVPLPDGKAPEKLRHKLTASDVTTDLAPIALAAAKPIVIGPPLRGSDWVAANGPSNTSGHRRALIPVDGRAVIAQRFAIDWVRLRTADATFQGDAKDNKSYRAYGAEVLAVADATVAAIKDGIPENVPGENSRAVAITMETVAGNHIILNLGGGRYCMYAHLQPGSLKAKVGDRVKRGQVLGLLGNSGNSTEPHLHFQVMDGPSPLGAEGLPYLIDSFELLSGRNRGPRENALPMEDMRVKFPM